MSPTPASPCAASKLSFVHVPSILLFVRQRPVTEKLVNWYFPYWLQTKERAIKSCPPVCSGE